MKLTGRQPFKKSYERPVLTRVSLKVEHNVLQVCHDGVFNKSPNDDWDCHSGLVPCETPPTL
jgi:hypothetical protein